MARNHRGNIRERDGYFQVRFCINSEYHTFRVEGTDRLEAEAFANAKYRELKDKKLDGSGHFAESKPDAAPSKPVGPDTFAVSFSSLLERFKATALPQRSRNTQKTYTVSMDALKSFFVDKGEDPDIRTMGRGQIQAFLYWRRHHKADGTERKKPVSGRTLEKDRAMAHNLFAFAEGLELVDSNPVSKVKPPPYDKRDYVILTDDQYEQLLTECEHHPFLQLYALVLGETGMRCESEALWMQWQDIDLEGGFIKIVSGRGDHRTKSGASRWVPVTERLRQALRDHAAAYRLRTYAGERSPWVFHHDCRRRRAAAGTRIGSLRRAFDNAVTRAGLPSGFTQHDLRHRRITTWLGEGKSAVLVKEAVGHSDLRTTMAYTHLSREHLKALVSGSDERPRQAEERRTRVS